MAQYVSRGLTYFESILVKYFDETKFVKISHCVLVAKKVRGRVADRFQTHTYTLIHCTKSLFFLSKEGPLLANFQHQLSALFFTGKKRIKKIGFERRC